MVRLLNPYYSLLNRKFLYYLFPGFFYWKLGEASCLLRESAILSNGGDDWKPVLALESDIHLVPKGTDHVGAGAEGRVNLFVCNYRDFLAKYGN